MQSPLRFLLAVALTALSAWHGASYAQTYILKTAAQVSPPKYLSLQNGGIGGIAIDLLRAIEQKDPALRFTGDQAFLPFARIQAYLASGELDVFVGLGANEARRSKYHYLPQPIYHSRDGIFVRADDPIEIHALEDIKTDPEHRVIVAQATIQLKEISTHGLNIDASAQNSLASLRMLLGGRGRYLYANEIEILPNADTLGVREKLRLAYVHKSEGRYIATSKTIHPTALKRLQNAVEALEKSGEIKRITERHLQPAPADLRTPPRSS